MKEEIKTQIYKKYFIGNDAEVRFSDLPKDIKKDDIIEITREESFFSENHCYDAYTTLVIFRYIEETEKEYKKRIYNETKLAEQMKKRRYETYLNLKSEFEPEN